MKGILGIRVFINPFFTSKPKQLALLSFSASILPWITNYSRLLFVVVTEARAPVCAWLAWWIEASGKQSTKCTSAIDAKLLALQVERY